MAGTFTFSPVSGTVLGTDNIYTVLNLAVNVTFIPTDTETLDHVTISADLSDSGVNLNDGSSGVTITGQYTMDLFPGLQIKYVPTGGTDKFDVVQIKNNTNDVPPNQEVFDVSPDPNATRTVTYTVTAYGSLGSSAVANYTYIPVQTYDAIHDWVVMYFE